MTYIQKAPDQSTLEVPQTILTALPPVELVREWFAYDPELKRLWWLQSPGPLTPAGSLAGFVSRAGYTVILFRGLTIPAHRLLWALHHGYWPVGNLMFRNGDRSDLRVANLRGSAASMYDAEDRNPKAVM